MRYHVREWGDSTAPRLFMLHGWNDVSASFQFIVDELESDWHILAPDWRGFGLTQWNDSGIYWCPDYLADLEVLLRHYSPNEPARLLGHSLGSSIALIYAGVRPDRVKRVAALDAFSLPDVPHNKAPDKIAAWLDDCAREMLPRSYPDFDSLSHRMRQINPELRKDRADWLARQISWQREDGRVYLLHDPGHRRTIPYQLRLADSEACLKRITAQVLLLEPGNASLRHHLGATDAQQQSAKACVRNLRCERVERSGHNMHHDRPEIVAGLSEAFFLEPA